MHYEGAGAAAFIIRTVTQQFLENLKLILTGAGTTAVAMKLVAERNRKLG